MNRLYKKGSLLVEALVSLLILSISIGISLVSAYNLLRKANENRWILNISDILLSECEQILSLNQSQITAGTKTVSINGQNYTISVTKFTKSINSKFQFYRYNGSTYTQISKPAPIVINSIVVVRVRVTDSKGNYAETEVVPRQW